jgi:hypothetical protein
MSENKIELGGIFLEGYGIIPKKLMKMKMKNIQVKVGQRTVNVKGYYIKLVLAYMLSYTGAGKNECFPSIRTIANDLEISQDVIVNSIKAAVKLNLIDKKQMYPDNPLKHNNKYILKFMNNDSFDVRQERFTCADGTNYVIDKIEQNNNSINNNNINISSNNKDDINQLMNLYPTRCFIDNRSTNRSVFNRRKLIALIKKNGVETCKQIITAYLDDCKKTKTYVKNFATLINNFPSLDDFKTQTVEQPPIIYKENNYEELI